jgi:PAS domain S-box-containing protein
MPPMQTHAVVMADSQGVIRAWSNGAEQLFGYDAASAVGQSLDLIVPDDYRSRHWAGFNAAMASGRTEPDNIANIPVRHRDGTVAPHPGRLILLTDAWGKAVGAVGVFAQSGASLGDTRLEDL